MFCLKPVFAGLFRSSPEANKADAVVIVDRDTKVCCEKSCLDKILEEQT